MPKAEKGTAKWIATQIRKKSTTRLRWYCGLCGVGCKDENGYKCHLETDAHIQRELSIEESTKSFKLSEKDKVFRRNFIECLIKRHFGQAVLAHDIYQELFPNDRPHANMKATCWQTLGSFVAQIRKEGRVEAQKGLKGWTVRVSDDAALADSGDDDDKPQKVKKVRIESAKQEDRPAETVPLPTARLDTRKVVFSLASIAKKQDDFPKPALFEDSDSED